MIISEPNEIYKFQTDIDKVGSLIIINKLKINETKCQKITFTRKGSPFKNQYNILGFTIADTKTVRDLGIILDKKWSFQDHLNFIVAKSYRTLGFIRRTTTHFTSVDAIIYLFKTLILPNLSYASIIWSPHTKQMFDNLNSVITRFLRYLSFKAGFPMNYNDHNYNEVSTRFNRLVPNRLFLDFCMANGQKGIKMDQIGTIQVKCDDISIPIISFYPRPLEKILQGVKVG